MTAVLVVWTLGWLAFAWLSDDFRWQACVLAVLGPLALLGF